MESVNINLAIVGARWSGKSTIFGHYLYLKGKYDPRTIEKFRKLTAAKNLPDDYYAWVSDSSNSEREFRRTERPKKQKFEIQKQRFTLTDTPGSALFYRLTTASIWTADAVIFVYSSQNHSENKWHWIDLILDAFAFGVSKFVVVVSRMDCANWSQEEFTKAVELVSSVFKKLQQHALVYRSHDGRSATDHQSSFPTTRCRRQIQNDDREFYEDIRHRCRQHWHYLIRKYSDGTVGPYSVSEADIFHGSQNDREFS